MSLPKSLLYFLVSVVIPALTENYVHAQELDENRFSGCTFVQYHNNNDSLSLPSEEITGMTWLDCHRLAAWANGLHIINTRTGETKNLFVPYSDKQYQYKFNWI